MRWRKSQVRLAGTLVAAVAVVLPVTVNATAQAATTQNQLLAKAAPDECWNGVGSDIPMPIEGVCPAGYQPKVNQAYVWGLTRSGDTLYFGTAPNTLCLVFGAYLEMSDPVTTKDLTCEFGRSPVAASGVPAALGDWRPPHIYAYGLSSPEGQPKLLDYTAVDQRGYPLAAMLGTTMGIRSAGTAPDGTVFLAGPSLSLEGGINMFARLPDGSWQTKHFGQYYDIRRWVTANGQLYAGVGVMDDPIAYTGHGAILRWAPTDTDPFNFVTVGTTDNNVAEVAVHAGRLFAGTWTDFTPGKPSGIWEGPVLPAEGSGGLPASESRWTEVWSAAKYEPDPVTASTYLNGAMVSFGGYLYWGTMHVPMLSAEAHLEAYPNDTNQALAALNTNRAISIYRLSVGRTGTTSTRLLYGESSLPTYVKGAWKIVKNKMNQTPLYGRSGFGNMWNNYTWSMAVFGGSLYVGTMDWSYVASQAAAFGVPQLAPYATSALQSEYGADLWRFDSATQGAVRQDRNGVGNYLNYGIRNMLPIDDGAYAGLYVGTANPANLATDPSKPMGGWELRKLS